jgi:Tol biopolymer transport system component
MRSDGSEQGYLTDGRYPDWSPDGEEIAFERDRDIHVIGLADSSVRRLTDTGQCVRPRWSPDGEMIAYTSLEQGQSGTYLIKPDGSGNEWLFAGTMSDWSPDGDQMVFVGSGIGVGVRDIWRRDLLTGDESPISHGVQATTNDDPRWSPNGELIAWSLGRNMGEVWLTRIADGALCKLHAGGAQEPAWSADGYFLAIVRLLPGSLQGSCTRTIWTVRSDGGECTQITFAPEFPE